ncbi:Stage II sporulation protein E (SpoIIE) [Streptomyces sp. DvalAA-14]|uniref:PP2C family protein-serine/threonine phosphatase n=1 Tax=unclassified Streptomyces TaxID=2593676 RepID=UPI00081B1216|nr:MULTISPECIES: PP2C family protein-serine/threonine phosphatase [unclassified Streptomyces]MYS23541.1 SpoIIE family protein phosphatase [Streptomyces sp. SID4948]SCE34940.1 Stage II sporulation protein E (SpoIIE) [Streptomyces sp. DvalAA-14]
MYAKTGTSTAGDTAPDSRLRRIPFPVLLVDADGVVRQANAEAATLLPRALAGADLTEAAPPWLVRAHRRLTGGERGPGTGPAGGPVGERSFEAHPSAPDDTGAVAWWLVDDTEHRVAADALAVERGHAAVLAEASALLHSALDLECCMQVAARLAATHLADAALVVAPSAARRLPFASCVRGAEPVSRKAPGDPAQVPGLAEALRCFPPVAARRIDPAAAPDWVVPDGFGPVGSMVISPLPGQGGPAGALILLHRAANAASDGTEETFTRLFAGRAGAAMSAARLHTEQTSITETLMRELMPPPMGHVGGVDFAARYAAARPGERVGGDFYDLHAGVGPGAESLVVLGDVCGKGLEAAVLTGKIRNTLHALLPLAGDHQLVLSLLNGALLTARHTRFATLLLASTSRHGPDVRLRLTSAGHPAPLVVRADGRVEPVPTRGTLVGALPTVAARTETVTLAPGDTCVLFTDGITEAKGGPDGRAFFGEARLARALAACAGAPPDAVVERLMTLASQWVGDGRHDDMAAVAITAPRGTHLSAVGGHGPGRFTG